MRFLNSKLIFYTLTILVVGGLISCKKNKIVAIKAISGAAAVCYGESSVAYTVPENPEADHYLWKIPEQAEIVSGQGTNSIVVNFGRKSGSVCVSLFSKGEEISLDTCLEVKFDRSNQWCRELDFTGGFRGSAVGFSIGNKGYIVTGVDPSNSIPQYKLDFWEFDPELKTWTEKAPFPGAARSYAVGFGIGTKGYIGTGTNEMTGASYNDFWEYDPATDNWTKKADCSFPARKHAFGFSIGNKGYIGSGGNSTFANALVDFYEYDPLTDLWTPKPFTPPGRGDAVGFSIGNKGYMGTGKSGNFYLNDFWEYNPDSNTWNQKADFPGGVRNCGIGFSINNIGYLGKGYNGTNYFNDLFEYNPANNSWLAMPETVDEPCQKAIAFSIGNKGYVGTGLKSVGSIKSFWVYAK